MAKITVLNYNDAKIAAESKFPHDDALFNMTEFDKFKLSLPITLRTDDFFLNTVKNMVSVDESLIDYEPIILDRDYLRNQVITLDDFHSAIKAVGKFFQANNIIVGYSLRAGIQSQFGTRRSVKNVGSSYVEALLDWYELGLINPDMFEIPYSTCEKPGDQVVRGKYKELLKLEQMVTFSRQIEAPGTLLHASVVLEKDHFVFKEDEFNNYVANNNISQEDQNRFKRMIDRKLPYLNNASYLSPTTNQLVTKLSKLREAMSAKSKLNTGYKVIFDFITSFGYLKLPDAPTAIGQKGFESDPNKVSFGNPASCMNCTVEAVLKAHANLKDPGSVISNKVYTELMTSLYLNYWDKLRRSTTKIWICPVLTRSVAKKLKVNSE